MVGHGRPVNKVLDGIHGFYGIRHKRNGVTLIDTVIENDISFDARFRALQTFMGRTTQYSNWYIGLLDDSAVEFDGYTGNRPLWNSGAAVFADHSAISNTAPVGEKCIRVPCDAYTSFTITDTMALFGLFLSNSSVVNVGVDPTGGSDLWSIGTFDTYSGIIGVWPGDELEITYLLQQTFSSELIGVTGVGAKGMFDAMFNGGTTIATWYVGLIKDSVTFDHEDTMAVHAGWTEFTDYQGATRKLWDVDSFFSSPQGGQVSTTKFRATAVGTVSGFFLASDSTKGGTSGTLYWVRNTFPCHMGATFFGVQTFPQIGVTVVKPNHVINLRWSTPVSDD